MKLSPSMRLKVNRDTFFLPDAEGSVYFKNNAGSFRMAGKSINQWVEKLLPMFNGDFTLGDITEGLPEPYRERVYDITGTLYKNGFLRDLSEDNPHDLNEQILKKYASQIEYLNSCGGSGSYRFQEYRKAKALIIGAGPILLSAVSALLESGLPTFHVMITDSMTTNRKRLSELTTHARKTDPDVSLSMISQAERGDSWDDIIEPFDCILYTSQHAEIEELQTIESTCRKGKKMFIPAICLDGFGMVGPLIPSGSELCWSTAWKSIHKTVFEGDHPTDTYSSTAGAMLANVSAFELFKKLTEVTGADRQQFYLLDLYTMEGKWHTFLSQPSGEPSGDRLEEHQLFEKKKKDSSDLFLTFSRMTSTVSGVFHRWEEGDLNQIPISQCNIQVADPLSDGPAELLPAEICGGLTHEEARREAGLVGLEIYSARIPHTSSYFIGAGVTTEEAVYRALQKCLLDELGKFRQGAASRIHPTTINDDHCRYYIQSLKSLEKEPKIYAGKKIIGFPSVWIEGKNRWYGSVGLDQTIALRNVLKHAVMKAQNEDTNLSAPVVERPFVKIKETHLKEVEIDPSDLKESLQKALQILQKNRRQLEVFELTMEPMLKKEEAVVVGLKLRKEAPLL